MTLLFDAEKHIYTWNGRVVPSVTQILQGDKKKFYTEGSAEKGRFIHQACEALDKDELDWFAVPPEIIPYVEAYEQFKKDTGFVPVLIEHPVYSEVVDCAGTIDRVGSLNSMACILDLKSGGKEAWHKLQTAGYAILYAEEKILRLALYLKKDGKYKLETHANNNDLEVFKQEAINFHKEKQYE